MKPRGKGEERTMKAKGKEEVKLTRAMRERGRRGVGCWVREEVGVSRKGAGGEATVMVMMMMRMNEKRLAMAVVVKRARRS